jgi:hypothetical protein
MNHTFYYTIKETIPANQSKKSVIKTDGDSYFLIQKIFSIHDNEYKILLSDSYWNKEWANDEVCITNFAGTPEFPAKILKDVILPPSTNLYYKISNPNDTDNNIELVFQGMKLYDKREMPKQRYRQYVVDFNIPANSKLPKILEIDIAKPFYVQKILGYKQHPEANLTFEMFDISAIGGKRIFDKAISLDNIVGRAMRPNIIPELKLIPQSVITMAIVNNENYNTYVQIVLDGYE